MANDYYVELMVKGRKKDLDEMQSIFQKEVDEGQTWDDWWTMHKSIKRMFFDPDKLENARAYTIYVERDGDSKLTIRYSGAWSEQRDVLNCIRKRWPNIKWDWVGVDEFGQNPRTTIKDLVGKYQLTDKYEGLNPFQNLDEWVGEEAVPTINDYYHTNYKTLKECFKNIPNLLHSDQMELCDESER